MSSALRIGAQGRKRPNWRLKELRINAGMSPNDLAYRVGVSANTVRLAERGYVPGPRIQFALAEAFDLLPLDLFPLERQPDYGRPAR